MNILRRLIIEFCLKHCNNSICNYLLFKLINDKELQTLCDIANSLENHRKLKKILMEDE